MGAGKGMGKRDEQERKSDWARMAGSYRESVQKIRERQMELRRRQMEEALPVAETEKLQRRIWVLEQEEREMIRKIAEMEEDLE